MKKIFYFILFAAMCGALFLAGGCDQEKKSRLVMVTEATFPPYEFRAGGEVVGIDPDIIREIAKALDCELIIEDMAFDSVITAVQSGKADVAASGITVTEDRRKKVLFSDPYVTSRQVMIVAGKSEITGKEQLKGRRIGVQHGTTGDLYVTKEIQEPERFVNGALAVAALASGKLDVVVLDEAPSRVHVSKRPNLKILAQPFATEEYAFAIGKHNPELKKKFDEALAQLRNSGKLEQILKHYEALMDTQSEESAKLTGPWEKLRDAFELNFVKDDRYLYLVRGFVTTMEIAFFSVILGIFLGFVIALIRSTSDQTGKLKFLNFLCKVYLTVIRGTPVVVQLLIIYFVIFGAVNVDKVLVAIVAFGVNSGAYVAEIIRGGIMSVDRGQLEAGRSLGLSYLQSMVSVILPQALKSVLPALGNEFIVLLKETSVSGYIALQDLTKGGDIIRSQTYDAFLPLVAVALIYLGVVMLFSWLLSGLEERLKKNER